MMRRTRLHRGELDKILARLSKDFGVDMQEVLELSEKYVSDSSVCLSFNKLEAAAHAVAVDEKIQAHLDECERCRDTVAGVKELSVNLNPQNSRFKAFWERSRKFRPNAHEL